MIKEKYIFLFFFLYGVLATPLLAQYNETIQSGRPGISIGPFTVGKNVFQIQTGLTLGGMHYDNESVEADILAEATVIRFGLTRTLEVNTAFTFRSDKTTYRHFNDEFAQSGLSQADVGFRVDLYEGQGILPTVGFQSRLKLNILSEDYNSDHLGIVCMLVTSQKLTEQLTLTTNWGAEWNNSIFGPKGVYTINLSFPIAGKLGGFVENFGALQDKHFITLFDAGLAYPVNNDLQLDFSGGYGKNNGINDYFVDAGVSWRFIVAKNRP